MNEQASKPIEYVCEETGEIYSQEYVAALVQGIETPDWLEGFTLLPDGNLAVLELGRWLTFAWVEIA